MAGVYEGQPIDAGLIIHEGQLTYAQQDLELIVDTGQWWFDRPACPCRWGPMGCARILGGRSSRDVQRLLHASIAYGLQHRREALEYASGFGRGLDPAKADEFVGHVRQRLDAWILARAAGRPSPSCSPADMRPA